MAAWRALVMWSCMGSPSQAQQVQPDKSLCHHRKRDEGSLRLAQVSYSCVLQQVPQSCHREEGHGESPLM